MGKLSKKGKGNWHWQTKKIADRLQIVSYRLQSLLRDYKKSDIGYKAYWSTTKDYKSQT